MTKKPSQHLSPTFIVLTVIAVSFFSYAMFNLGRLPTPEEKRKEFETYAEELQIAEEAQSTGVTIDAIKRKRKEDDRKFKLKSDLQKGIASNNESIVITSLEQINTDDLSATFILGDAIQNNNLKILQIMLNKGMNCNSSSVSGRNAFHKAIISNKSDYLKMLIDHGCSYNINDEVGTNKKTLGERIVRSPLPIKIFNLSEKYVDPKYREKAFSYAISKGYYEQVATMLTLGMTPETRIDGYTPLHLSLLSKKSDISFLLIRNGASILTKSKGIHVLTTAFMKGEVDVAKEILTQDPNYIHREQIEHTIISKIFHLDKNPKTVRASLKLLVENSVPASSIVKSYPWLRKAINLQDSILAEQLLTLGSGIYDQTTINKALKYVESRNINIYHKNKIIVLLHGYDSLQ
jgi:ankyrin repeat protein